MDTGGAVRSGVGALGAALAGAGSILVVAADRRGGLATGADEREGGDGASALLVGDDNDGAVLAQHIGSGTATAEFLDRWRTPGSDRPRSWEERFGETQYVPLGEQAWNAALKTADLSPDQIDRLIVTGLHSRSVRRLAGRLGASEAQPIDDLASTVGNTGTAHPGLLLASALDEAEPGQVIALVALADGADVHLFRATESIVGFRPARSVAAQVDVGGPLLYGKFLSWRGMVTVEPPNRPEPARVSSSAAARGQEWKFGFVGSRDRTSGMVHLPPSRVSERGGAVDDMEPVPMADVEGTVVTYTVDRLVYSPSPPVVFAVVDFDGGGRVPIALTDVDADEVAIGDRVEMTFRRLSTTDEIHNYFWKARPIRA